ncbi:hypothetical protein E4582_13655 [Luteimonas yindakuii]|uniref:Uncharacterized protein n=1 Tax=Luteimonas yindakuii TaxID=2565782 RepID=A0A4Z1R138_9GAMM|nr:hypothetical protein [Luteimonas yindakuii]QCO66699.1 hypothetical protein E5843_00805 [Luteimonas yindakuii]TKS53220.1 hypothetical protein E4582_13655 [Luteimonas yindakuii]
MAKPNYNFEKRQRELAKKRKQDAKDAKKREAREAAAQTATEPQPAAPEPADDSTTNAPAAPRVHLRSSE